MDRTLLIDEWSHVSTGLLEEAADGSVHLFAKGRFGLSDVPTANKRVYRKGLMEREINKKQKAVKENTVYGELDHPGDGKTQLSRASHRITKLQIKPDGEVYGEALIMNTGAGKNLQEIVKSGGKVGVSSRGYGTTRPDGSGNDIVQEDYNLITFDFVADPAAVNSYPEFKSETIGETKHSPPKGDLGGSEMTIDELRKKFPELYNELVNKIVSETKEELGKDTTKDELKKGIEESLKQDFAKKEEALKRDFAKKLEDKVGMIKEKATEEVRSELLSDPQVAGAKVALEDIASKLRSFLLPEDINEVVTEKDKEKAALEEQLASIKDESAEKVIELEKERDEYKDIAKKLGYELHLNNFVNGLGEDIEVVKNIVGDVMKFDSIEELEGSVKSAIEQIKEMAAKEEAAAEEIQKLREDKEKYRKSAEEAQAAAMQLGLYLCLERKITGHPHLLKVRKIVESAIAGGSVQSAEDIDAMLNDYKKSNPVSEEYDSIRRSLSVGNNGNSEIASTDDVQAEKLDEVALFGNVVSMDEMVELCGVPERKQ